MDPIITTSPKKILNRKLPKIFFQKTSPTEKGEIFITGEQEKGKIQHKKKRNDHTGSEKILKSRIAHTVVKNNEQKKRQ